jgi:hypothetical protein
MSHDNFRLRNYHVTLLVFFSSTSAHDCHLTTTTTPPNDNTNQHHYRQYRRRQTRARDVFASQALGYKYAAFFFFKIYSTDDHLLQVLRMTTTMTNTNTNTSNDKRWGSRRIASRAVFFSIFFFSTDDYEGTTKFSFLQLQLTTATSTTTAAPTTTSAPTSTITASTGDDEHGLEMHSHREP